MVEKVGRFLDRLIGIAEAAARIGAWIGGGLLILCSGLIGVEVVLRRVAAISITGVDELSYYAFAISTSWALTWALLRKAHVRVDVVYSLLPTKIKALLDVFAILTLGIFAFIITYRIVILVQVSISRGAQANTPMSTPLWIPQSLWLAGFLLFTATIALLLVRIVWSLVAERDSLAVVRLVGGEAVEIELDDVRSIVARPTPDHPRPENHPSLSSVATRKE